MSERDIAFSLMRRARPAERPRLAWYFLCRALNTAAGLRLRSRMTVSIGGIRFLADVRGMSGLVFFEQILCQRIYEFDGGQVKGVLFDVGANCGFFSLVSCLKDPGVVSYCFEPHPRTFEKLAANAALNQLTSRMHLQQVAVGSRPGTCDIEIGDESSMAVVAGSGARLTDSKGTLISTSRVSVPLVTLDEFAAEKGVLPDAIKVDVEGFEIEVLRGASNCLRHAARAIVEVDSEMSAADCRLQLEQSGFQVQRRESLLFGRKP